MYIPKHYRWTDKEQVLDFIQKYPFANLVTGGKTPMVTHLPFVVRIQDDKLILRSHMAKENPQSDMLDGKLLVVFQHPHAYITPSWYENEINVPTWNYLAAHCYGEAEILSQQSEKEQVMRDMFDAYDKNYFDQYERLPITYKEKLLGAIVAFDIEITEVQAKAKISQNKKPTEQVFINDQLHSSIDPVANELARWMQKINAVD